jgi:hypothetical protein
MWNNVANYATAVFKGYKICHSFRDNGRCKETTIKAGNIITGNTKSDVFSARKQLLFVFYFLLPDCYPKNETFPLFLDDSFTLFPEFHADTKISWPQIKKQDLRIRILQPVSCRTEVISPVSLTFLTCRCPLEDKGNLELMCIIHIMEGGGGDAAPRLLCHNTHYNFPPLFLTAWRRSSLCFLRNKHPVTVQSSKKHGHMSDFVTKALDNEWFAVTKFVVPLDWNIWLPEELCQRNLTKIKLLYAAAP